MLKCNLFNDVAHPVYKETSVGRLIQYKAIQEVVELAFLRFSTFGMLLKYTRFPWNVGWVNERCARRERGGEKRREKVKRMQLVPASVTRKTLPNAVETRIAVFAIIAAIGLGMAHTVDTSPVVYI